MKKFAEIDKKKMLVIVGLFALVVVAAVVNYAITAPPGNESAHVEVATTPEMPMEDAFATFKQERTTQREQEISYIDSVISSAETDEAVKNDAQTTKLQIVGRMEKELNTEGLIKTKMGFECVASVTDDNVNIVVDATELTQAQVAQIVEIVKSETDIAPQNIKVMPKS